jgi:hypothetical protein
MEQHIVGVAEPLILEVLGVCDECGQPATWICRDSFEVIPFLLYAADRRIVNKKKVNRWCEAHYVPAETTRIREGSTLYEARMRAEGCAI